MSNKTRIVIAEDHAIFRRGMVALLAGEQDLEIVGEAVNGEQAIQMVEKLQPEILLLDLLMPKVSGMEVLQALADTQSSVRVIVLSGAPEGEQFLRVFELGARALVLKESATAVLFQCIQAVKAGQYWIGQKASSKPRFPLKNYKNLSTKNRQKDYGLTQREIEIIQAVASGAPNKEIAERLSISEQTVKHHITNIFDKVGAYNRLELTLFAFHHGLADDPPGK
jgi:two-component system, NarL family, nitrate/nitrite response regulator NarL